MTSFSDSDYNTPLADLPPHCRVAAKVATSATSFAGFELWLPPPDVWNKRFLATGNGGWAGAVNYPDIKYGVDHSESTYME
jgi:feruloyl esterase